MVFVKANKSNFFEGESPTLSFLSTAAFKAAEILLTVGVDIPVNCNFQRYQNSASFWSYQNLVNSGG